MDDQLTMPQLLQQLEQVFGAFPDLRRGANTQYDLADAGLGAFAVFFMQNASFLEHQQVLKAAQRQSNAERLFGLHAVPSDNQIRNLLDPVNPTQLWPAFRHVFLNLERAGVVDRYRSFERQLLIGIDGTQYFSSPKLHCPQCSQRVLNNRRTQYSHSVVTPVLVQPNNPHVLALEPEFIVPQDGHEKQDCEIQAAKRWLAQHGAFYAQRGATLLGDDLYSRQPFCQALRELKLHFILVCKPDSHGQLYTTVDFLAAQGLLGHTRVRRWNGRFGEIDTYRYAEHLPLTGEPDTLSVNWCELTITREDTGEQLYKNAWATDFEPRATTVEALVRAGRARWKVENENNNVLKTKGYHLEHNFGHGQQYLSAVLLSLNLLAFLWHTVFDLVDERYRAIRKFLRTRRVFFRHLDALLLYVPFEDWTAVWVLMSDKLELNTS